MIYFLVMDGIEQLNWSHLLAYCLIPIIGPSKVSRYGLLVTVHMWACLVIYNFLSCRHWQCIVIFSLQQFFFFFLFFWLRIPISISLCAFQKMISFLIWMKCCHVKVIGNMILLFFGIEIQMSSLVSYICFDFLVDKMSFLVEFAFVLPCYGPNLLAIIHKSTLVFCIQVWANKILPSVFMYLYISCSVFHWLML